MCRGPAAVVCLALITALSSGCVGPARATPDYLADMVNSAQAGVSSLETARLAVDAVEQGRSTAPYASLQLSEAETDTESVIIAFSSVQPPSPELDEPRAELISALQAAASVLGDLRVAAFRGDLDSLPGIAERIADVRERLETIALAAQS